LILSAVGPFAAADPKKDDADSPKGKWSALSISLGGKSLLADEVKDLKCTFDDKSYTQLKGSEVIEEGDFKVDTSKSPKTIDFDIKKGPDNGKKQLGIYKIDGEKLTLVVSMPGSDERPKSFKIDPESQVLEFVFEKVKP